MFNGIIYCAISPSGKKYYGQTIQTFEKRKARHKRDFLNGCNWVFYQAINKYGWDSFKWMIIEKYSHFDKNKLLSILNERESHWIKTDKTYFREFGYNMTAGGDNYKHIRKPLSQETKNKIRQSLLNKPHTEQRKKNQLLI